MFWVVLVVGAIAVVGAVVAAVARNRTPEALGTVSDQWISEHRFGQGAESRR